MQTVQNIRQLEVDGKQARECLHWTWMYAHTYAHTD